MLLITHTIANGTRLAFLIADRVYNCHDVHRGLPETGEEFVAHWEKYKPLALLMHNGLETGTVKHDLPYIEIGEAIDVKALVWPGM
jgi:hypothetical protein